MIGMRTDFFIVGTAKAGTSALHAYLCTRPEVCMCSVKEPNYFSYEEIAAQGLYYRKQNVQTEAEYHNLFRPRTTARLFGEASVSYLYYPMVARRIYNYNPKAKILICLREPVRRAYSHYCMDYALGLVKEPIETIWRNGAAHPKTGNHYRQYFQISEYSTQVWNYLDVFPREQILIILHEELCMNSKRTMSMLSGFLGIEPPVVHDELPLENVSGVAKSGLIRWLYRHHNIRKTLRGMFSDTLRDRLKNILFSKSGLPDFPDALQRELQSHYAPMNESLQALTGLDLHCWEKKKPINHSESVI